MNKTEKANLFDDMAEIGLALLRAPKRSDRIALPNDDVHNKVIHAIRRGISLSDKDIVLWQHALNGAAALIQSYARAAGRSLSEEFMQVDLLNELGRGR